MTRGWAKPMPVVLDFETEHASCRVIVDPDQARLGSGMAHDVCQCLLNDPVGGHLDSGGQGRQRLKRVDGDTQATVGMLGRRVAESGDEPEVVECRGSQRVDQAADIGNSRLGLSLQAPQQSMRLRRVAVQEVIGNIQLEGQTAQHWAEPVVQIPT